MARLLPRAGQLRSAIIPLLAAASSLFAGLMPTMLVTGRVQPLDWLMPAGVALLVMLLAVAWRGRKLSEAHTLLFLALLLFPALLLFVLSASTMPWIEMAVLVLAFLSAAGAMIWAMALRPVLRWAIPGLCLLALFGVRQTYEALERFYIPGAGPEFGLMSSLPLWSDPSADLASFGAPGPVVRAAGMIRAKPIDLLTPEALAKFGMVLLAQPRQLSPAELVALDDWVRRGGRVIILADPWLSWPSRLAPSDARRAPLTSLLDPLMTHWGLTLEPAPDESRAEPERRLLASGQLIQLQGASQFTLAKGAPCQLYEQGLIAQCQIGEGHALLVADADWINDELWTLNPDHPGDRQHWLSDAMPLLSNWLAGAPGLPRPTWAWLISQDRLISALRWALGLLVLLALWLARMTPFPMPAHDSPAKRDESRPNMGAPPP